MAVLKDLIVHGPSRFLNGINANSIKADTINAKNGYFKYLKAIDGDIENLSVEELLAQKATVVGLLDVKGELHTNTWTNSNIANIGGVFYISPTVISTSANVVIGGNENSRTLTVSGGSFATTTVPTWNGTTESTSGWVIGSRVMVTGSVTYNNVEYPLGTCIGYISGALTSSGFTVQQISSEALESIFAITGTNSLSGTNIQISMYEIGPGNNNNQSNNASYKPVGILMTSYGMADKSTHIDIYGGVNAKNTSSKTSGMADPNVRIGHLGGLDSYTDSAGNTRQPTGWGIYTDNGYFKGVIVADSGSIGHFTIDANAIYSGEHSAYNTSGKNGIFIGRTSNTSSDYYVSGGPGALWYLKSDGSAKIGAMTLSAAGVLTLGSISLNSSGTATIGPWIVNSTSIYKGSATQGAAGTGNMYFGNNGLSISNTFTVSNTGVLNATGAVLKTLTINDSKNIKRATVDLNGLTIYKQFTIEGDTGPVTETLTVANFNENITLYTPGTEIPAVIVGSNGELSVNNITITTGSNERRPIARISGNGLILYDGERTDPTDSNVTAKIGTSIILGKKNETTQFSIDTTEMLFSSATGAELLKINTNGGNVEDYHDTAFNISSEQNNKDARTGDRDDTHIILDSHTGIVSTIVNGPIQVRFDDPFDGNPYSASNCSVSKSDDNRIINFNPTSGTSWSLPNNTSVTFSAKVTKKYSMSIVNFSVEATVTIKLVKPNNSNPPYLNWTLTFNPDNSVKNKMCYGGYTHLYANGRVTYTTTGAGPYYTIGSRSNVSGQPGGYSTAIGQQLISNGYPAQTVIGKYNNSTNGAFVIGNGNGSSNRSNALVVDWSGNLTITGNFIGKIVTSSATLPQFSGAPSYLVGIEAFADGGQMKWQSASNCSVGYATSAGSASSATTCTYPAGFASRNDNATWGNTTGTTITCWNEVNGGSIDFRRDNPSSGKMSVKVDGRFYYNEGNTPVWGLTSTNGYWGMTDPDGNTGSNCWIRTTQAGIIPYESGGAGSGHQYLGTASWYFSAAYVDNIYAVNGTYSGNIIAQGMAGQIIMFAGSTAPAGWLICNGQAVSRTTYAKLFSVIGTTWGTGNGSSTFNIPDLRGRAPIGAGTGSGLTARTLGATVGEENHTLSAAESGLPAHTHSFTQPDVKYDVVYRQTASSGGGVRNCTAGGRSSFSLSGGAVGAVTSGAKSASSAHNNMQPSAVVNFIICTGQIN